MNPNLNSQVTYGAHHLHSNPFSSNNFYWDWWNNYYQGQTNSSHLDIASVKDENKK
jgi:hypothetical protein